MGKNSSNSIETTLSRQTNPQNDVKKTKAVSLKYMYNCNILHDFVCLLTFSVDPPSSLFTVVCLCEILDSR